MSTLAQEWSALLVLATLALATIAFALCVRRALYAESPPWPVWLAGPAAVLLVGTVTSAVAAVLPFRQLSTLAPMLFAHLGAAALLAASATGIGLAAALRAGGGSAPLAVVPATVVLVACANPSLTHGGSAFTLLPTALAVLVAIGAASVPVGHPDRATVWVASLVAVPVATLGAAEGASLHAFSDPWTALTNTWAVGRRFVAHATLAPLAVGLLAAVTAARGLSIRRLVAPTAAGLAVTAWCGGDLLRCQTAWASADADILYARQGAPLTLYGFVLPRLGTAACTTSDNAGPTPILPAPWAPRGWHERCTWGADDPGPLYLARDAWLPEAPRSGHARIVVLDDQLRYALLDVDWTATHRPMTVAEALQGCQNGGERPWRCPQLTK